MQRDPARLFSRLPPLPFVLAIALAGVLARGVRARVPFARPLGVLLLGAGVALDAWSIATQLRAGTSPVPAGPHSRLVTWGPYAWSRNPIYIAHALVAAGLGMTLWRSGWAFLGAALAWKAADRWIVPAEEEQLASLFGAEYEAYSAKVGRWWGRAS
jgi:protein-S-isoprenylcysteine O-methyltransferase Ste14